MAGEMAKLASSMDFGMVLRIACWLILGMALWSGIYPYRRRRHEITWR
jgi:hypothetical protein